jgi:hypothetical protein
MVLPFSLLWRGEREADDCRKTKRRICHLAGIESLISGAPVLLSPSSIRRRTKGLAQA